MGAIALFGHPGGPPAFTKMDAVVSHAPKDWGLSVGVQNLTDTTYFIAANSAGAFVGDPGSVFVEFKVAFGKK
jgi:iron complex outermembrane recepter protein